MRVILLKSIERLGAVGDIVDVADGYARNWLLPHKYGLAATPENIRQLAHRKRKILAQEKETFQKLQTVAAEVAKQSVTIMARATEEDHLFGSVTARDIADAFCGESLELEARMILLEEPIKELGCYNVRVRLHPEIEVTTKVWVVRADDTDGRAAAPAVAEAADTPAADGADDETEEN
jgi:large subunit ribosomal protein L9